MSFLVFISFHFFSFYCFSLEQTIANPDHLQFDALLSFGDHQLQYPRHPNFSALGDSRPRRFGRMCRSVMKTFCRASRETQLMECSAAESRWLWACRPKALRKKLSSATCHAVSLTMRISPTKPGGFAKGVDTENWNTIGKMRI